MELWELLDAAGSPTGELHRRGDALPQGRYHAIIGVWTLHRRLKRVLITRRAPEKIICPNRWENTGGSVIAGETAPQAAARELREETGLHSAPGDLIQVATIQNGQVFANCFINYTAQPPDSIVLQAEETVDYRWVSLAEIDAIIAAGHFAEPEIIQYRTCRPFLAQALQDL